MTRPVRRPRPLSAARWARGPSVRSALVSGLVIALALGSVACASSATNTESSADEAADESEPSSDAEAPDDTSDASAGSDPSADPEVGMVAAPVRSEASSRSIYMVIPDRFANGDPSNDTAGLDGGPLDHGFLPTDKAYHHGGDLVGLTDKLDYLAELGVGAIWITPPFRNNFVQGDGTIEGSSSSYHGYWQIDWDQIDPHLGTDDEMHAFIDAAHERDIDVYFDVVVNHTGDIITYADDSDVYYSTSSRPYRDAAGAEFDPSELAGSDDFPELDPAVSFPHVPEVRSGAETKSPAWLNDVTLYHNRGDSSFSGESDTFGDFFGLDDLFTEHPAVVEGMSELHGDIIERYGVDGFRVDTVKHVNPGFWAEWVPAIRSAGAAAGKDDFFVFGEVYSSDPILGSSFTNLGFSATLDFRLWAGLEHYVAGGGSGDDFAGLFDDDDWYTDADNNASMLPTFFGNHDAGRLGRSILNATPGKSDEERLARAKLGYDVLFTSRGTPVIYYGDEQGFTGDGGDQLARQDMFPSQTPEYLDDVQIGSDATPADDNFDPNHPLYRHIAAWNAQRVDHPALVAGAHLVHPATGPVHAVSRIDRDERIEYLVATNVNGSLSVPARVTTLSADTEFVPLWPSPEGTEAVIADDAGEVLIDVPPLTTIVLRADGPIVEPDEASMVSIVRPDDGAEIPTPRYRIEATIDDGRYAEVTFSLEQDGAEPVLLGVDDAAPYRVYWDTTAWGAGDVVTLVATVDDGVHPPRSDRVTVTLGDRDR